MKRLMLCFLIILGGLNCTGTTGPGEKDDYEDQTGSVVGWGGSVVVEPDALEGLLEIDGGERHSIGLKPDGSIVAWGSNLHDQCDIPEPNTGFEAIACGEGKSLGLKSDGTIVA